MDYDFMIEYKVGNITMYAKDGFIICEVMQALPIRSSAEEITFHTNHYTCKVKKISQLQSEIRKRYNRPADWS